ncbi:MAG: hypothetical protein P8080_07590 [Gammaproteobacteria bacterium]
MNARTFARGGVSLCLAALLCAGALWASASYAGDMPISIKYSGTGFATAVDVNGDGENLSLTLAEGRGTFGRTAVNITSEFVVDPAVECEAGYVPYTLFQSTAMIIVNNGDQLFGFGGGGTLCLNPNTGYYYGDAYGVYYGGTGRFATAVGEYTSDYTGYVIEPFIGTNFRSIQGTLEGTLSK